MVEVPGTRILDFFFSKSDKTNNSLHLLANRYIDQSQIDPLWSLSYSHQQSTLTSVTFIMSNACLSPRHCQSRLQTYMQDTVVLYVG